MRTRLGATRALIAASIAALAVAEAGAALVVEGRVVAASGAPIAGAMVTVRRGDPIRLTTVFSDADGSFRTPDLEDAGPLSLRVRRIGFRDLVWPIGDAAQPAATAPLVLEPETDPAALAAQLPANRWLALLLEQFERPEQREEFVRQCTYCHQQGNAATRLEREDWQWEKILALMARMGGTLSPELRAQIPARFRAAYAPEHAVPRLTVGMGSETFAPPPAAAARRAVVDEWELGGRASMQHDLAVHPDGRVYSVDMTQDQLYRLDPRTGEAKSFPLPPSGVPLGGAYASQGQPLPSTANARLGPHSLQVAPDGSVWATLALGNRLGRFDPRSESWQVHELAEGIYPHTLRFDAKGRIWFTLAVSNHVARFDPASQELATVRLPAASYGQALALRLLPALLWLSQHVDLSQAASEGGGAGALPVPYGIDVAPDGGVWFSQLNQHKIGRIDPETLAVEMVETPFTAPRRLRFDAAGVLWIPGFSSSVLARFDPKTRAFETFALPIDPPGTDTPYALNVERASGDVWICGTNSDSLLRYRPLDAATGHEEGSERMRAAWTGSREVGATSGGSSSRGGARSVGAWTVYPLPTRVTYTREIDFDAAGRVWTSNSNLPAWQVEGGFPRVLRLDPAGGAADVAAR